MTAMTEAQVESLTQEFSEIGVILTENDKVTDDIQVRTGNSLSTIAKRDLFALFMTELFKKDKDLVKRHQDCISKAPTQRIMQGIKADAPLTKRIAIRTADKGLLNKNIATKKQVADKGVYFQFTIPIKAPVTLTSIQAIQKVLSDRKITEDEFKEMALTYHVVAH
jgi:hypothetical protein|tara:strand:- start:241 stop:738 length:498 start_codon:yes stop_codon:yes gene_type:complete